MGGLNPAFPGELPTRSILAKFARDALGVSEAPCANALTKMLLSPTGLTFAGSPSNLSPAEVLPGWFAGMVAAFEPQGHVVSSELRPLSRGGVEVSWLLPPWSYVNGWETLLTPSSAAPYPDSTVAVRTRLAV